MTEDDRLIAGRYRLLERLGRGGMGVVWRGRDESLDRWVAIKELVPYAGLDGAGAEEAKRRVMREGRIAARLQHPHAVSVYNVVEHDGRPWLIMEYLSGRSLADILAERGALAPEEVLRIGTQLASALAAAHGAGVVHRDVKPGNALIAEDGTAKLTDFGISRAVGDGTITATGDIAGTPAFFAPEVARGEQATFASDVFSLGATLYNAVEGTPPFGADENQIALLYRVAGGQTRPPGRAGVLTPVLLHLLDADPGARPDVGSAHDALVAAATGRDTTPVLAAQGSTPPAPARRSRKRAVVAALGAAALIAAGILAFVLPSVNDGEEPASASGADTTSSSSPRGSPPPSSTTATTPRDGPRAREQALASYYSLIPSELRAGYARLTEGFKSARSSTFNQYRDFWQRMADVRLSDVRARGQNEVAATITYVHKDGSTETERHVYTLVRREGGWAIDAQRML